MHIKAPLLDVRDVEPLVRAGADEFFCGVENRSWRRRFRGMSLNQRSGAANFQSLKEFSRAAKKAHRLGARIHVAVNAFFFLAEQYQAAETMVSDVRDAGADAVIFADPVLLRRCRSRGLPASAAVIGCDGVVFNSAAAAFYRRLGARRIVFPREMTIEEMRMVIGREPGLEYEAFIINDLCFFVDGFCSFCKDQFNDAGTRLRPVKGLYVFKGMDTTSRGAAGGCRTVFSRQPVSHAGRPLGRPGRFSFWRKKVIDGCGACAVYALQQAGVSSLKVLDRNLPLGRRVVATRFIAAACRRAAAAADRQQFIDGCRGDFRRTFKAACSPYDCYYPDALK